MQLSPRQIAEAFSGHEFEAAYPYLADDVHWDIVGAEPLHGKESVVAACSDTAKHLSNVTSTFERFRVVVGADSVVVDSVGLYVGDGHDSRVASCDLYDFRDGQVVAMTSYTVELPG